MELTEVVDISTLVLVIGLVVAAIVKVFSK